MAAQVHVAGSAPTVSTSTKHCSQISKLIWWINVVNPERAKLTCSVVEVRSLVELHSRFAPGVTAISLFTVTALSNPNSGDRLRHNRGVKIINYGKTYAM